MSRRSDFGDLLEPGLRKIIFEQYDALPTKYDKIFNVMSSSKQDETDSGISGFGQFDETSEGGTLTYEDPLQGYDVSYVHKSYKKGFKVTEELYDDDQYSKINKMAKGLAVSAKRTVETVASNIIKGAFGTTYATGGDSVALCSAAHTRADGGANQSNTATAALAEAALETGRLAMRNTLDDKGQLILVQPNKLIVPAKLEDTALIMMKSSGRPYANSVNYQNDVNPNYDRFEVLVWDYIGLAAGGSDTAWFLMDSAIAELNFFWRKQFTFEQDKSFSTDEALFKGKMRFSVGFSNWRGFYGSTGGS